MGEKIVSTKNIETLMSNYPKDQHFLSKSDLDSTYDEIHKTTGVHR